MTEPAGPDLAALAATLDDSPTPSARADAWHDLGLVLAAGGRRDRGLVAVRTALSLRYRSGAAPERVEASRRAVRELSGPDVVPMHVDMAAGEHDPGPDARAEAQAAWVGAPEPAVLAMLGWVERDGGLDVVRVVVPGTGRGRGAFSLCVAALPDVVAVTVRVPVRDPAVRRVCERAGFVEVPGSLSSRGHVGGSVRLERPRGGGR